MSDDLRTTAKRRRKGECLAPPADGWFLLGIRGEVEGLLFPLDESRSYLLGRDPECDIRIIQDEAVSRRHARLEASGDVNTLLDLGSANGTHVEGEPVKEMRLHGGQRIALGDRVVFRLVRFTEAERLRSDAAYLDPVRGCYNRHFFNLHAQPMQVAACERGVPASMIFLDVDDFGIYNKRHGVAAADEILRAIVQAIIHRLRRAGAPFRVCRYGGDEFAVLLPETNATDCASLAELLRADVASLRLPTAAGPQAPTVSVGAATVAAPFSPAQPPLAELASNAARRAKEDGKNRVVRATWAPRADSGRTVSPSQD